MYYLASFVYNISGWWIAAVLFIAIFIFHLLGIRLGRLQKRINPLGKSDGMGPLEGALLGLLALLLSFTFNMSASRFDTRRKIVIQEANHISSVIMRADLYPDSVRRVFRANLKQYLEARIAYYHGRNDEQEYRKSLNDAAVISARLWKTATDYARHSNTILPNNIMLLELNNMIDVVTTRDAANLGTVPGSIIWLLVILTVLASCIIGYSKREEKSDWAILGIYALMTVLTIYTIIDLDRPGRGYIKTDVENGKIIELRELVKDDPPV